MTVRAVWLEMTGTARVGLRRATRPRPVEHRIHGRGGHWYPPDCGDRYHEAITWIGTVPASVQGRGDLRRLARRFPSLRGDPAWPKQCAACDYEFHPADVWQDVIEPLYTDGGRVYLLSTEHNPRDAPTAPDGSMWDGWWLPREWQGPDRRALVVRCPGGVDFLPDAPVAARVYQWFKYPGDPKRGFSEWRAEFTYRWQREGSVRRGRVTVHPEIEVGERGRSGHWYGRLTDGEFIPG